VSAGLLQHGKRVLERLNNVLKGHVLSLKYRLLAVLVDLAPRLWEKMSIPARAEVGHCCRHVGAKKKEACLYPAPDTFSLRLLLIVVLATKFEPPVCEL